METSDIISLLVATYKDYVEQTVLEETRESLNALISAEADARRNKMATDIRRMGKLKIALSRFEIKYNQIREKTGSITAIDDYIADIRAEIKTISFNKNH